MFLKINSIYSQKDIQNILGITIMRGMNFKIDSNRLVLVRNHIKSIYTDRQEGDVLYYTGEGRIGDQSLTGANKRLLNSNEEQIEVHLFEVFKRTEYTYKGIVHLVGEPLKEIQEDENGNDRTVYIFPLQLEYLASINEAVDIDKIMQDNIKKLTVLNEEDLRKKTKKSEREKPGYTYTKTKVYQRSPYVIESVERRAAGICELCDKKAPFNKPNGKPYLEVHHIVQLSKNGADKVENAVALCPNCHRKMHSLSLKKDIKKLQLKAIHNISST